MTPRISLLFVGLHVLLYVALSLRVVMHRRARRIGLGSGGDELLTRKVRVHANFAEYAPLALLLLALLELGGLSSAWLWLFGGTLLLARVLHAVGLGGSSGYSKGRFLGALLTFATLLAMALVALCRSWLMATL